MYVNGLCNKFSELDDSVVVVVCLVLQLVVLGVEMVSIMLVFSLGQIGLQVVDIYVVIGCVDLIYMVGGGIFGYL